MCRWLDAGGVKPFWRIGDHLLKIGIIGTGNIGGTLARKLSVTGHEVRVANSSGVESVRAFAREIALL